MTIIVNKPSSSLPQAIVAGDKTSGQFGNQLLKAETAAEAFRVLGTTGRKNMVINGDCRVKQRGVSSITVNYDPVYPVLLDQWRVRGTPSAGVFTLEQTTDGPTGFPYTIKATVSTADTSITTDDRYAFGTAIEGYNFARAGWGTPYGQPVTISFWVKSNVASPYHSFGIFNRPATAGYTVNYGINDPGVWEFKTITVFPTNMGVWDIDTNMGAQMWWSLGMGDGRTIPANVWTADNAHASDNQINLMAAVGNYIQVTGVQVELGTTATPFEYRTYQEELALCQRYYWTFGGTTGEAPFIGQASSSTQASASIQLPVTMRATPSVSVSSNSHWTWLNAASTAGSQWTGFSYAFANPRNVFITGTASGGGLAAGNATIAQVNTTDARMHFDAQY